MRYLSVCSGIEAATVAWHPLKWEALAFSEIEPFPRKVLSYHYPDVRLEGDFTVLREQDWIKDADILVGGTPCQAFSVAGLRNSLDDDRGNLTLEFVRLADAIDDLRRIGTIIVWENVPGVLSVKDNAFGCFLGALVGNDEPLVPTGGKWTNAGMVVGPKRRAAWRILDAQYFGVAQRRRRVFVIASSRDDFDPAEVLFEREGLRRDTPPGREKGQNTAKCLTTGVGQRYDPETETLPVVTNSNVSETLTSNTGGLTRPAGNANELDFCVAQPIPFGVGENPDLGHCLRSGASKADKHESTTYIAQPMVVHGTQDPCVSDIAFAQGRNNGGENVFAIDYEFNAHSVDDPTGPLLKGSPSGGGHPLPAVMQSIGTDCFNGSITGNIAATLGTSGSSVNDSGPTVMQSMAVRRLTPRECERLQGFPDDYTSIPNAADSPRYKALGNSMAVPVMAWLGKRIQKHMQKDTQ